MQTNNTNLADQLQTESAEQRALATEQFVTHLRGELDSLVALLSDKQFDKANRIEPTSAAFHALEIVQFARYVPAAGLCVQRIDTRRTDFPAVSDEKAAHFPFFPYAVAVAAIGMPCVSALNAGILAADTTTTRFQLSCVVLREILGEDFALQYVGNLAKTEAPLQDAKRMEQATHFIQLRTSRWDAKYCSDYSAR